MPEPVELPIKPHANTFGELMSRVFRIPRYQRAYDWDDEEVADFLRDLQRLYERRRGGEASAWHFFGALVTIMHVDVALPPGAWFEVVDGQQRLATLLMTLAELRRALAAAESAARGEDESAADTAAKRVAALDRALEHDGHPRLTLSRRDRQYFAEIIAGTAAAPEKGADEAHRKLYRAHQKILTDLIEPIRTAATSDGDRVARLVTLHDTILNGGYAVHLYTDDRYEAYRLFSVLNDRGRPLGVGSLLRTHTLSVLEGYERQQDEVEDDWDALLAAGEAWVDTFLGAFYASHAGERVTKGEMFDAFRSLFSDELPDERAADETQADKTRAFVRRLRAESEVYDKLQDGEWPYDDGTASAWDRDRLGRLLKILRHTLALPLMLAVAQECEESRFTYLVLLLERFVFRYINIARGSADALAKAYYPVAKEVRAAKALDGAKLEQELQRLRDGYATDEIFLPALKERLRYRKGSPAEQRLVKHFLTTLEDHYTWFAGGAADRPKATKHSVFDFKKTNLEHIYPRNPRAGDEDEALEEVKDTLGNLTLLDEADGKVAGNERFAEKIAVYENSKIALTRELAEKSSWSAKDVEERADRYAEMAAKVFVV